MSSRYGVYGGTFNPIHLGHLRAAEELLEALDLECMWFVPSGQPPHKRDADDLIAPAELRLEWTRLAVEGNPRFRVDPLETAREGPSYLVDTLRQLRGRHGAPPIFCVGRDAFVEMDEWREPREIFRLANVAVTNRPPFGNDRLSAWLPRCVRDDYQIAADDAAARHREAGTWVRVVPITALDISASQIRECLREGRSTRYLLPEDVRTAVEASGCYAPSPPAAAGRSR